MNFGYNYEMSKDRQIVTAFIVPLFLASVCLIAAAYLQEYDPNRHCQNGVCFGSYEYYETPNLEYIYYCFIAFVMLALMMPFILYSRSKHTNSRTLNLYDSESYPKIKG
jgi:hypothetical protein